MIIRQEAPADRPAVIAVIEEAFRRSPERPAEAALLEELFECSGYIPELSLVAANDDDGAVCGHVITTRAWIGSVPSLGLGPIGVLPEHQRTGIGRLLMTESIARAAVMGERSLALLGDPALYGRFGFQRADVLGILPPEPEWGQHFMVRALGEAQLPTGTFRYAEPFNGL